MSYSAYALKSIDVTYTHMRRAALGLPRYQLDPDGSIKSTSLQAIYFGRPLPSQLLQIHTARLVGHALRSDTPLRLLFRSHFWRATLPKESHLSLVARLLNIDFQQIEAEASDRAKWRSMLHKVHQTFCSRPAFTSIHNRAWHRALAEAADYEQLQYVEEGQIPHLMWPGFLHAYTDGSSHVTDNVRHAGWGVIYTGHHRTCDHSKGTLVDDPSCTNNRAEFYAVIDTLLHTPTTTPLCIHTDSMLVWDFFHHVMPSHRFTNYERYDNSDLLVTIFNLHKARTAPTHVIKVRAHCGNPLNEQVDVVAKNMAQLCERLRP